MKPRSRIRRVSTVRAKQLALYAIQRPEYLQSHPLCECGCGRRSSQIHHRGGREGEWLNYVPLFMATAMECHEWIERNKTAAEAKGWITRIYSTFKEYIANNPNF